MTTALVQSPRFRQDQRVMFVGGEGIVRSCKSKDGKWAYIDEMALGIEPMFGRVGAETMVLLSEADFHAA